MTQAPVSATFDVERVRKDFPILERQVHGRPLVYLDSANTSQKPRAVLDAIADFYERHNANVARAVHALGEEATAAYEGGRDKVARFINAPSRDEVIFAKNSSEALNLVANTLAWATGPLAIGPGRRLRTDLTRAILRQADLRGADARHARFLEADLGSAKLDGCDLAGAELEV